MGIRGSPPVARNVLENRQNPALLQPLRHGSGDGRDLSRFRAVGAVANYRVGARHGHVSQRQTVDTGAEVTEIGRDQSGAQPRSRQPKRRIEVVKPPKYRSGRIDRPVWWAKALDPPPFLIDQDRSIRPSELIAHFGN